MSIGAATAQGDFQDEADALAFARRLADKLVWHADYEEGASLLVVDDAGVTIAALPLIWPPH